MVLPNDDRVIIELILDAKQANAELQTLLKFTNSTNISIKQLQTTIKQLATASGSSFAQVGASLKQMYASQVAVSGASREVGENLKKAFSTQVNQAIKNLNEQMRNGEGAARSYVRSIDAVRIALGAIVAMVVFRTIQFIEESMRKAIETAKEYETSLYRLANVESILSQSGIETSVEGLRRGIQEIKDQLPIFSEADITQQVSLIGIMTKELGVTEQQVIDIAKAIGVLNIRSGETESLMSTTNKVLTAMVAPSGRGIASLGLDFGEANIEATAFRNNILKIGESFKDLTDNEKDMIKIAILLENTGQELETVQKFLETSTGALAEQSAEWEDTLRTAGQALLGLQAAAAPFVIGFLNFLQDSINGLKAFVIILQAAQDSFFALVGTLELFRKDPLGFLQNREAIFGAIGDVFSATLEDGFKKFFTGQIPEDAPEWFKRLFGEFVDDIDTATASVKELEEGIQDIGELEGFDDLVDDLGKLQDKLEDLNEDFSIDQARAWEDYQIDVQRLIEDYAIKREKIIEDTNDKIEDANRKHHNRQKDDEAKFQEQMRQLREKFLFNLEDALRERDARQVLRLQRQYQMDKTALENEHALRQQEQDRQHQEDLQRIRDDRDDRLRELAEEERIRLQREREDYELKKQREEEDHARDLEDLKERIDDRLMEFARALGEEFDLNEEGVNAIYDLLQQYYGPNGLFDGLYDYSYDSMVARAQSMLSAINQIVAQAASALSSVSMFPQFNPGAISSAQFTGANLGGQAKGGTYLATRPTTATFGEAGPEIAQFIPLSKLKSGNGAGSVGGNGMGGLIELDVVLSPDLEARITRNTLNDAAQIVTRVRRTKN